MNSYYQLYETIINGFLKEGFEIYKKSSYLCIMRRWKLVDKSKDMKIIETGICIFIDNEDEPTNVQVRYAYHEQE